MANVFIAIWAFVLVIAIPILQVLGGAFCGWLVSLMGFEPIILYFLHSFGVNTDGLHLWMVGAWMVGASLGFIGFIGAFFRTTTLSNSSSKD